MKKINAFDLTLKPADLFLNKGLLLTAGDWERYNAMTIGWGSIGAIWGKPFIQVVVRPVRYTFEFMNGYPTFTVCAFPDKYKKALNLLGSKSGRDGDKISEAGLTIMKSSVVEAPCYREAEMVIECRKIYWQDLDSRHFLDDAIKNNYPKKDYHRVFFGDIVYVGSSV